MRGNESSFLSSPGCYSPILTELPFSSSSFDPLDLGESTLIISLSPSENYSNFNGFNGLYSAIPDSLAIISSSSSTIERPPDVVLEIFCDRGFDICEGSFGGSSF